VNNIVETSCLRVLDLIELANVEKAENKIALRADFFNLEDVI